MLARADEGRLRRLRECKGSENHQQCSRDNIRCRYLRRAAEVGPVPRNSWYFYRKGAVFAYYERLGRAA